MPIADRNTVRRLAGNRSAQIVPDDKIDTAIMFSDTYIKTYTQNYTWAISDVDYESVKKASEYLASSEIRAAFQDETDESEEQWDRGISILDAVNKNSASAGASSPGRTNIRTRPYRTTPLNPNVPYKRAISYSGETVPID